MKTLLTRYSVLALMFAMLGLASCTEESSPDTPNNLAATSLSSTSIKVRWDNSTATDEVIVTPTAGGSAVTLTSANGTATITGLTLGQTYTIQVKNDNGSSSILTWAPARRWPLEQTPSAATLRLWSTSAPLPSQPSGLIIGDNSIRAVSTEGAEQSSIDMVFAFDSASNRLYLQSPKTEGSGIPAGSAQTTRYGNTAFLVAGGLDNDFYTASVSGLIPTDADSVTAVEVLQLVSTDAGFGQPLIAQFLTQDGHFGRVEIVPQDDGKLFVTENVGGVVFDYIDLRVSYQTIAGLGYVGRPRVMPGNEYLPRITPKILIKR